MKPTKQILADSDIPLLTPRKITALKRSNNRKRPSKRKLKRILTKARATKRAKKAALAQAAAKPPKPLGCQHPRARGRGTCACDAVGERLRDGTFIPQLFTIPPTYEPESRFAGQPQIPRPQARLCLQHRFLVEAHVEALVTGEEEKPADYPHRRQCAICLHDNQSKVERTINAWLTFTLKTTHAAAELGVSVPTFNHHCYYYRLDEKRAEKDQTRKFLLGVMDASIGAKASAKDGIAAAAQLSRERGDVQNVDMRLAVKDLTNLSDAELAELARKAAAQLEAEAASKASSLV